MPTTWEPLAILAAHNHWATKKVLKLCHGLTREQFHQSFPIGPGEKGGLHATLTHVISAMRRWADRIAGHELRKSLEKPAPGREHESDARDRTPDELIGLLDESTADLVSIIRQATPETMRRPLHARFGDTSYTFTTGAALTHALTHGHYHRAQCLNMLRQLRVPGVSDKLPELDVVDWQYEEEPGVS